jgi:hypothetical protein
MAREYRQVEIGYSGKPLVQKLGIKSDSLVRLINAPSDFDLVDCAGACGREADVILLFCEWERELCANLDGAIGQLAERGGLWIAWPKKASKAPTDLTEDRLREIILPTGLVDNMVCAIDEKWSGLRFVRRRKMPLGQVSNFE